MILAALVAPIVGPFTIWRVIGRAGNVEDCVWASHQMREWLRSRNEAETNAEPAADAGNGPTLSLRVRYHLVLIRFRLRLLALRVVDRLAGWVSK